MMPAGVALVVLLTRNVAPIQVSTFPAQPVRGTLAQIIVTGLDSARPYVRAEGVLAHEPLHFVAVAPGRYLAFAGVPIEGTTSESVRVWLVRADSSADSLVVGLKVSSGNYRSETLRVDPRLTRLDSADQARVARENAQARSVSLASHRTPRLWEPGWQRPRPGRVTSVFGTRRVFNKVQRSRHLGTDFAGQVGAPVMAPNRGVVVLVEDFLLAGKVLFVDHGAGLVTGFFHLSEVAVAVGDTVWAGQRIGAVGNSGRVTGPHLHWIARYGAVNVNPMSMLELQ